MEKEVLPKTNFVLSDESESFLKETANWAYFLSILGFIFIGLIVLVAIFMGAFLSNLSSMGGSSMGYPMSMMGNLGGFIAGFYLIIAAIYFFLCIIFFNFHQKQKLHLKIMIIKY